ncbi:MAG: hypothetical protein ABFD66_03145 [Smithella sp.]
MFAVNGNYKTVFGGCRGRAYTYSGGDYLAEDPRCFIGEDKKKII